MKSHIVKFNSIPPTLYDKICAERLKQSRKLYENQLIHELKMQESMQSSAYDAMRFHRHFAITTLWPPLHTREEINYVLENFFKKSDKYQRKLNKILKSD